MGSDEKAAQWNTEGRTRAGRRVEGTRRQILPSVQGRTLYLGDVRKYNRMWEKGAYPSLEEFKPKLEDLSLDGV